MRSEREANINKALDEGRYKDALAILASAINAGFGHGWYASVIQSRGLCLCYRCDAVSVPDFRTLCPGCQAAENKTRAECQHPATDRDHHDCRCGKARPFCGFCSSAGPVYHVAELHRPGWVRT